MFSVNEKRIIANRVQMLLQEIGHPELPEGEIQFLLHVDGAEPWSWADIRNNGAVDKPDVNPWNEYQAKRPKEQPWPNSSESQQQRIAAQKGETMEIHTPGNHAKGCCCPKCDAAEVHIKEFGETMSEQTESDQMRQDERDWRDSEAHGREPVPAPPLASPVAPAPTLNVGELDGQSLIDMNNLAVGYMQPSLPQYATPSPVATGLPGTVASWEQRPSAEFVVAPVATGETAQVDCYRSALQEIVNGAGEDNWERRIAEKALASGATQPAGTPDKGEGKTLSFTELSRR
jgi:hypothetical protein